MTDDEQNLDEAMADLGLDLYVQPLGDNEKLCPGWRDVEAHIELKDNFYTCKGNQPYCKKCKKYYENYRYANDINFRIKKIVTEAIKRDKIKNIESNIDVEYVMSILSYKCPIDGRELKFNSKRAENSFSLDAINPKLGHVKGNVRWVSWQFNNIKDNMNEEELYIMCKAFVKYYEKG